MQKFEVGDTVLREDGKPLYERKVGCGESATTVPVFEGEVTDVNEDSTIIFVNDWKQLSTNGLKKG